LLAAFKMAAAAPNVTHFVQLYPQPLYTASQVRTTCRSWDEGVLTDLRLTGVLTDLCLILYINAQCKKHEIKSYINVIKFLTLYL